ncbi:hypothetical protein JHK87_036690 [Glycine soja]|nr:hypothetical protein JHK87_036690 [Glycine soja]
MSRVKWDNIFEKNIRSGTTDAVNLKETNTPAAIDSISVAEGLPSHGFHDKCNNEKSSDVNLNEQIGRIREALPNEDLKIAEQPVLELNTSISDSSMEDKRETDALELDEMKMEDDSTAAKHLLPDVIMKDKRLSEVSTASGGLRVKRRTPQGLPLFPFRRLLNPTPFKKKGLRPSFVDEITFESSIVKWVASIQ